VLLPVQPVAAAAVVLSSAGRQHCWLLPGMLQPSGSILQITYTSQNLRAKIPDASSHFPLQQTQLLL